MDLLHVLTLIGSVAMLMYGMKVMSEGVQKMAGASLRNVLGTMTTNRFTGLLTGSFITAAIQSSTATTVMTVSFVSAGLLSLAALLALASLSALASPSALAALLASHSVSSLPSD